MRAAIIAWATAVFLAPAAMAQDGNPAGMEKGAEFNALDRVFSAAAAQGGMAEVEFGALAGKKTDGDDVKDFAKRMVGDHGKANERLNDIAAELMPLPKDLDPEHKAMLDRLRGLSGWKFDAEYMRGQVADHQKTAQLLEHEIGSGQNEALKAFAQTTLPTVLDHLQMAQIILARLTGSAQKE